MRFLGRRLLILLLTGWAALTLNFILPRLMPGNPIQAMLARYQGRLDPRAVGALEVAFGLNTHESAVSEYFTYFGHTVTGNLGTSIAFFPTRVSSIIGSAVPWTLGLVGFSIITSFVLGTTLGAVAGWRRGSRLDSVAVPFGVMLSAMPVFWISLLALYFLAFRLGWFPVAGGSGPQPGSEHLRHRLDHRPRSVARHHPHPGQRRGLGPAYAQQHGSVLGEDYIKFGRAKGLPDRVMAYPLCGPQRHPAQLHCVRAGARVRGRRRHLHEYVFSYPGIAYYLFSRPCSALTTRSYKGSSWSSSWRYC